MLLYGLKESLNLTILVLFREYFLKQVLWWIWKVTIEVATISINIGQMDGMLDSPVIR